MLVYLDMCCLKRPFDDQSQPRIHLETEAVLGLLSMEPDSLQFVRSEALVLENSLNPVAERAARVEQWLAAKPLRRIDDPAAIQARIAELMVLGLKGFDALHIASAEATRAAEFVTADHRLLAIARRNQSILRTRVLSVIESAQELLK